MSGRDYDALSFAQTAEMYMVAGVVGVLVDLLVLLSYFFVPNIKAQHPAADVVVWQVACGLMTSLGFIVAYVIEGVFFMFASTGWYLMLSLDLFVALVNPWMGYNCKSWAYHTIVWSFSGVSAFVVYQRRLYGVSAMNMCWIKRTHDAATINKANWAFLYGEIIGIFALSLSVLLFASFRFVRRQLDVTYRAKRRNLLQYYRYLLIYGGYWSTCGGLYYASYLQNFQGEMAQRIEVAFVFVFGSYPVLLLVVWTLNTELYQNRSSENSLPKSERGNSNSSSGDAPSSTEHFSAALRKDLMRYTTAGICCSINDTASLPPSVGGGTMDSLKSPLLSRSRANSMDRNAMASLSLLQMEESEASRLLYNEKKRLATTVYNGEYRYYEKLGFTDYAPKIFQNIREVCGIDNLMYEQSFADTLLERASEGKSGMLFYFTSDRKYLVKTMTKWEHSFLLNVLPLYHQYILKQPNSLLCRFLGCHSMQLPVGWNKMFFVVMENVFPDGPVDERYDLKGIFHQSNLRHQEERTPTPRWNRRQQQHSFVNSSSSSSDDNDDGGEGEQKMSHSIEAALEAELRYLNNNFRGGGTNENQPLLRRGSSRSSLRHDNDFVSRRASLRVNSTTRANLLAQVTSDCGFLQELGIMDYSCLLGIRHFHTPLDPFTLDTLAHNAVVSEDQKTVYYLGFVDILQHYNFGWKVQNCLLSVVLDKRSITALPPAEYALRFLSFIHEYLLRDPDASNKRSYGSIGCSPPLSLTIDRELTLESTYIQRLDGAQLGMEAELQQTLDELCDDLLRSEDAAATSDQNAILQSLTELALRFPQAQKILGRSLAAHYHSNDAPSSSTPSPAQRRGTNSPVKLSLLAQRFLYRRETAQSAISLLAALANENSFNQQRIVRSVTGVRLTRPAQNPAQDARTTVFDAGKIKKKKRQHQLVLYALTVPDSVKYTFRKWRKRQKHLQSHRIPSGAPPEQGGVPKPCFCNECLGAEQFLPTWQLHFQDLSRWTKDPQSDDESLSNIADKSSSSLTCGAFFQVFLQDFRVCTHIPAQNVDERRRASIYYFVPPSEVKFEIARVPPPTNTSAPPAFDPLQHVCAIEITPDVNVLENAQAASKSRSALIAAHSPEVYFQGQSQKDADEGVTYEAIDRVMLLEGRVDLSSCSHTHFSSGEDVSLVDGPGTDNVAWDTGAIVHFLSQVEEKAAGKQVTKTTIEAALVLLDGGDGDRDDDATKELLPNRALSGLDHKIFRQVLDFLEDDDVISLAILRGVMARPGESSSPTPLDQEPLESPEDSTENDGTDGQDAKLITETPATSSFSVQVIAYVETRELVVTCTREDHEDPEESLPSRVFSTAITLEDLLTGDDSSSSLPSLSSSNPLALLCIEESELRALLLRCQVCFCSNPLPSQLHATYMHYLRPQEPTDSLQDTGLPGYIEVDDDPETESQSSQKPPNRHTLAAATSIPGLPDDVSRVLLPKLEALVSYHHNSNGTSKSAFQTKFPETLSLIIKSCNARIMDLATSRATSSNGHSEVHRKAGMERCRQCRDLLIQLGKKVKLALEPSLSSSSSASSSSAHTKKPVSEELPTDQLARISKLVRKTVAQVQTQSQSVHAWETPDVRVHKLQLNPRVWASGFPDPEFYRERDALALENKKKQRLLNQQLMRKQVKQLQQQKPQR